LQNGSVSHPLAMATLTLKNVPDDLYRRLKARAEQNHRSLNREAIRCLEASVTSGASPLADEAGARARALRERLAAEGVWITADEVHAAIERGRE
jgi:plasmid stability protein